MKLLTVEILPCSDVDECSGMNGCDINAACVDTIGSFICICDNGYTGNGTYCEGKKDS